MMGKEDYEIREKLQRELHRYGMFHVVSYGQKKFEVSCRERDCHNLYSDQDLSRLIKRLLPDVEILRQNTHTHQDFSHGNDMIKFHMTGNPSCFKKKEFVVMFQVIEK